jgi:PEP-CTERM motif
MRRVPELTSVPFRGLAAAIACAAFTAGAQAATYDFSYTFAAGGFVHQASGQVEGVYKDGGTPGDTSDDYIETPSVLSATFDGSAFVSPTLGLYYYDHEMPAGYTASPTNMYFTAALNNFILSHCGGYDCFVGAYADPGLTIDYFMMRTISQGGTGAQYYTEVANFAVTDVLSTQGVWSLTAANPVPEPQTWAMLGVGLALVGAAARRRR